MLLLQKLRLVMNYKRLLSTHVVWRDKWVTDGRFPIEWLWPFTTWLLKWPLKIFFRFPTTCSRNTTVTFVPRSVLQMLLLQKLRLVMNCRGLLSTHVVWRVKWVTDGRFPIECKTSEERWGTAPPLVYSVQPGVWTSWLSNLRKPLRLLSSFLRTVKFIIHNSLTFQWTQLDRHIKMLIWYVV